MVADVSIRDAQNPDLAQIAVVHVAAFPDSAITKLGSTAVERYYAWLMDDVHDATNLVAVNQGKIVGFVFAGTFKGATSGFLRRNRVRLLLSVLRRPTLLRDDLFRDRLSAGIDILRGKKRTQLSPSIVHPGFGILAIAVNRSVRGAGTATLLMDHAEEAARARGVSGMLLTVALTNARAIAFYEKLGWKTVESDSRAATMIKDFTPTSANGAPA